MLGSKVIEIIILFWIKLGLIRFLGRPTEQVESLFYFSLFFILFYFFIFEMVFFLLNADMNRTNTVSVGCVRNPVVTGNDPRKLRLDTTRDNSI